MEDKICKIHNSNKYLYKCCCRLLCYKCHKIVGIPIICKGIKCDIHNKYIYKNCYIKNCCFQGCYDCHESFHIATDYLNQKNIKDLGIKLKYFCKIISDKIYNKNLNEPKSNLVYLQREIGEKIIRFDPQFLLLFKIYKLLDSYINYRLKYCKIAELILDYKKHI
jgi:hypothetical protein